MLLVLNETCDVGLWNIIREGKGHGPSNYFLFFSKLYIYIYIYIYIYFEILKVLNF